MQTNTVAEAHDPFTLEIVADSLRAISDEMFITTQRTSQSITIYEVLDFSVGITDPSGRLISQGNGVTLFLGTLDQAVESVLDKFGEGDIAPGDLFVTNDPYGGGGTHLSDLTVIAPVFHEGELVGFAANKAHWADIGGKEPGSMSVDSTEVYQEGLQIPCVKIAFAGAENTTLVEVILENSRTPELALGDLNAQRASVRLAGERFSELCGKYGTPTVRATIDYMIDHAARAAAIELAKLPHGTYRATDFIDGNQQGHDPVKICVAVTVSEDGIVCDFTGTEPAGDRPTHCSKAGLICGAKTVFKAIMGPDVPANAGTFRGLEVVIPDGTVFSAVRPMPTSAYWDIVGYVSDLVQKALAEALPHRLTAGHFCTAGVEVFAGDHPETGEFGLIVEVTPGGWGAAPGKDGERGLVALIDGETYTIPVEIMEQRYGLLVEQIAFNTADGAAGAGQWRGGEGIVREFQVLSDRATVTGFLARNQFPAWGAGGGADGSKNEIQFFSADGSLIASGGHVPRVPLERGDRVRIMTGHGGGWGNPLERDPAAVASDVLNEYISVEDAERTYGVLVDPATSEVTGLAAARRDASA